MKHEHDYHGREYIEETQMLGDEEYTWFDIVARNCPCIEDDYSEESEP